MWRGGGGGDVRIFDQGGRTNVSHIRHSYISSNDSKVRPSVREAIPQCYLYLN